MARYDELIDSDITWIDHGKVDLDAWAHHFESEGTQYVLLYEDFPDGSYLKDGLSHEVVNVGNEMSIGLKFSANMELTNITRWYTLYREIRH